ncbi:MAG: MoaD/ThiS family protein [Methanobacteriota archaeon]|nr:MAG: MoaD/ThiS family protein [Euryarchaeota archaeon]TLZ97693.1 MAG: MoaD/ThiS family protein [Euryarchaeota archaeon]
MRCHDEGDPRTSVPVFLALRGPGRPEGPGVPLPRRPPVRGRTAETRGGPRCVPGPTRRRAPPPPRRDPGPRPPALRAKALRRRGHGNASMRIQVRLFATYREIVGSRGFTWSSRDGLSLRELVDGVVAKYPRLADHRDTMLLAVNHDLAASDRILRDGDEVALLPPVSGGAR